MNFKVVEVGVVLTIGIRTLIGIRVRDGYDLSTVVGGALVRGERSA